MRDLQPDAMKTGNRFFLHILLPPLLGALLMLAAMGMTGGWTTFKLRDVPMMVGFMIVCAYVVAGIPSFIYAALMEGAYCYGIAPGRRTAGLVSALLGLVIGSIPWIDECLLKDGPLSAEKRAWLLVWASVGLLVGALVESVVGWFERRHTLTRPISGP